MTSVSVFERREHFLQNGILHFVNPIVRNHVGKLELRITY